MLIQAKEEIIAAPIHNHISTYSILHRMTKIRIANSVVRSYLEALSSNAASLNLPV